jgi:hypothetical protein
MTLPDDTGDNAGPGALAPEAGSDALASFAGDRGQLPLDTRRVLVQLLQGPAIDGARQTKLWPVLLRDEQVLRSRLHDLFLELVIDHAQEVAFLRQVADDDIDAPVLLRRATLSFLETVLLLYLRQRLTHAEAQGERAVVSLPDMLEHLRIYERDQNVDHVRFERQMDNAIEKAKKLNLLRKLRSSDDRFEVIPTLKLLFPAEEILALIDTYQALRAAAEGAKTADPAADTPPAGAKAPFGSSPDPLETDEDEA